MRTAQLGLVQVLAAVSLLALAQSALSQTSLPQTSPARTPSAQNSSATVPEADAAFPIYDVSVIRPSAAENEYSHVWTRLNTLEVRNISLLHLLESAFDVPEDMIVGLPEWAKHERLDIDAKTLDPEKAQLRELTVAQRRAMMQALFEDRLGLKWHYETRVLSSYDLLIAKGGPKLKSTVATGHNVGTSVNDTRCRLTNVPVSGLTVVLSDKLGRPVVDKTGLTGRYDMDLVWSPDLAVPSVDPDAPPPLFTALQDQLGLKLESGQDPVQVFVIDRLTPPAAN